MKKIYETLSVDEFKTKRIKEAEYINYIEEHIKNVKMVWKQIYDSNICIKFIKENIPNIQDVFGIINTNIINHDKSKFSDEEFDGYRKNFHSISDIEKEFNKKNFDKAWEHHYKNNPHHWEYWKNRPDEMSLISAVETCCDWIAMSIKFGGTAIEWYEGKKDKIILGEKQEKFILELLRLYYKYNK